MILLGKTFKYFDWPLLVAGLLLSLVGLIMIYSTGLSGAVDAHLWLRQLAALVIGLAGLIFFSDLDYHFFKKSSTVLFLFAILLLVLVLPLGQSIRGSTRWFNFGVSNFQPAELSKFALIILLAKFFQKQRPMLAKFRYIFWSFLYVLVPVILIMLQPDLGSAAIHLAIWFGMLLISAMPRRYFLYLLIGFLVVSAIGWQFFLQGYQKDRIKSFLDPTADPLGRGYNVIQSIVAVGSGGFFGSGLARGLQSQLKFLPERQTDFIFASTVEELGLLGGGLVIFLFIFLLWRLIRLMRSARDLFGIYVAAGIFFLIFTQSAINIAMNVGLLPVTGVTLPLVSYGGSSLVITFWLIGILENVAKNSVPVRFQ